MKSRIPTFKSTAQEREFWQRHSVTEFFDELTPVKLTFAKPRRKPVSLHLTGLEVHVLQRVLARLSRFRAPHTLSRKG